MSAALTQGSSVKCQNQGTVALTASQSRLKVGGQAVLVDGDLASAHIGGCTTVTNNNTGDLQCQAVLSVTGGVAGKLKVGGKGVLLDNISGKTNGLKASTPQSWSVTDAGQTRLKAV
jgi:hypothetical protein